MGEGFGERVVGGRAGSGTLADSCGVIFVYFSYLFSRCFSRGHFFTFFVILVVPGLGVAARSE